MSTLCWGPLGAAAKPGFPAETARDHPQHPSDSLHRGLQSKDSPLSSKRKGAALDMESAPAQ
eukprot:5270430-Amphidinium_carterae.1